MCNKSALHTQHLQVKVNGVVLDILTSTIRTPGMMGLSGKWPGKKLSLIVTFLMATADSPGLYSITLSTRRKGNLYRIHETTVSDLCKRTVICPRGQLRPLNCRYATCESLYCCQAMARINVFKSPISTLSHSIGYGPRTEHAYHLCGRMSRIWLMSNTVG
jgi:hypothetical protein